MLFQIFKILSVGVVPYSFIVVSCSRLHNIIPAFVTHNKGFENEIDKMTDMEKEAEN